MLISLSLTDEGRETIKHTHIAITKIKAMVAPVPHQTVKGGGYHNPLPGT